MVSESKTVGIVASGPSATIEDARKLRQVCDEIIAVNDAWRLCRYEDGSYFNDHIYGTDMRWWQWAIGDISRDFEGQLWTQRVQWTEEPEGWGIKCFESEHKPDICTEKGKIHTGQNSGFAAINVAYHMGFKTIILLGFDMMMNGERRHFFDSRPSHLNVDSNYNGFIRCFETIQAEKHGICILNASRRTALRCFPLVNLDEMGERCAA